MVERVAVLKRSFRGKPRLKQQENCPPLTIRRIRRVAWRTGSPNVKPRVTSSRAPVNLFDKLAGEGSETMHLLPTFLARGIWQRYSPRPEVISGYV
ncbi:MAG: hypothetical protein MJA29_07320 [Candidatus Omnitrophica bacterium]|nr:hypothetical protein [Candidatus Omnitrophota bacterium]